MKKKYMFLVVVLLGLIFIYLFRAEFISRKPLEIAIFYTGEVLGELEPCGCSGVKTGGIVQRSSWIRHLQKEHSSLLFLDGGFSAVKENRQQEIKFSSYHKILEFLKYDFRSFTTAEREKEKWNANFKNVKSTTKTINEKVLLIVHSSLPREELQQLVDAKKPDVFILMTEDAEGSLQNFPQGNFWSFILLNNSLEPTAPYNPQEKIIVMGAGNRGRYAGLLRLSWEKEVLKWRHEHISLTEEWPKDPEVTKLMEEYKQQVKEEKLLDYEFKRSSPIGFVGSEMCGECHVEEFNKWREQSHSKAFVTLQKQNYHHDPECVSCHVVGYDYAEGYRNFIESDYLIHVGCESCHGAGAQHAFNPTNKDDLYGDTLGESACINCHKKDHSPHFDYNIYKPKIKHWK